MPAAIQVYCFEMVCWIQFSRYGRRHPNSLARMQRKLRSILKVNATALNASMSSANQTGSNCRGWRDVKLVDDASPCRSCRDCEQTGIAPRTDQLRLHWPPQMVSAGGSWPRQQVIQGLLKFLHGIGHQQSRKHAFPRSRRGHSHKMTLVFN